MQTHVGRARHATTATLGLPVVEHSSYGAPPRAPQRASACRSICDNAQNEQQHEARFTPCYQDHCEPLGMPVIKSGCLQGCIAQMQVRGGHLY